MPPAFVIFFAYSELISYFRDSDLFSMLSIVIPMIGFLFMVLF